jgi:dTDP-4-dehydrorhamnose reductase
VTALVVGAGGQLGRALQQLRPEARFTDFPDVDLSSRESVAALPWAGVSAVINAAAWTAVDAAESPEKLPSAWDVNATGVFNLAWHARRLDVPLVHVSTDYVFRGNHTSPIPPDAPLDPKALTGPLRPPARWPRTCPPRTTWCARAGCSATDRTSYALCAGWRPTATN